MLKTVEKRKTPKLSKPILHFIIFFLSFNVIKCYIIAKALSTLWQLKVSEDSVRGF